MQILSGSDFQSGAVPRVLILRRIIRGVLEGDVKED